MSEGRVAVMNDAARDGELDLGAVGRALVRKKWWVLGPAHRGRGADLRRRQPDHAEIQVRSAHHHRRARERVLAARGREGRDERDRTVDPEAVTSQVQLALSRDVARQVIKELKLGERPEFDSALRGVSLIRYSLGFLGLAKDPLSMTPEERVLEAYYERLDGFPGRQVARDLDRIPVVRSGARRAASRTRSRTITSRCSSPRGGPDPRGRQWLVRRDRRAAQAGGRGGGEGRGIPLQDQPVHRHQRHDAVEPDARRSRTAISRRRARRRPSSSRRRSSSATCSSAAARSNPPT